MKINVSELLIRVRQKAAHRLEEPEVLGLRERTSLSLEKMIVQIQEKAQLAASRGRAFEHLSKKLSGRLRPFAHPRIQGFVQKAVNFAFKEQYFVNSTFSECHLEAAQALERLLLRIELLEKENERIKSELRANKIATSSS